MSSSSGMHALGRVQAPHRLQDVGLAALVLADQAGANSDPLCGWREVRLEPDRSTNGPDDPAARAHAHVRRPLTEVRRCLGAKPAALSLLGRSLDPDQLRVHSRRADRRGSAQCEAVEAKDAKLPSDLTAPSVARLRDLAADHLLGRRVHRRPRSSCSRCLGGHRGCCPQPLHHRYAAAHCPSAQWRRAEQSRVRSLGSILYLARRLRSDADVSRPLIGRVKVSGIAVPQSA